MPRFRTAIFWLHLFIGVVAGLFILNMAASGILIAYQKQITAWAERDQKTVAVPAGANPLDFETLAARVEAARPKARLSGVVLYSDPAAAALFRVGRENNILYADPYTGEVRGEGAAGLRRFFQFMTSWHRWLALEGTSRSIGEVITGTASLAYFALLLSGLFLWLPRQWSRARLRQGALADFKLRGKPRDWNWHNVAGLWCAPLLLLVTLTGIIMSHTWADDLLFHLTGSPVEHRRDNDRAEKRGGGDRPVSQPDLSGLNSLWAQAEKQAPGWRSISLRFAGSADAPATFLIDLGDGGRPDTTAQLTLDRDTGEVVRWQPYSSQNEGHKLHSWIRPIHTGEAGGLPGQTLAVIAALGGITLVWTGLSLAWRRFFGAGNLSSPTQPTSLP